MFSPELMKFLIMYQQCDVESKKDNCNYRKGRKLNKELFLKRQPVVIPIRFD